jgi:hypothetical protein
MALIDRQSKAIPIIVANHTISQGAERAGIERCTYYDWLKEPEFKAELDRQRDDITAEAFGALTQSLTKAVETLQAC